MIAPLERIKKSSDIYLELFCVIAVLGHDSRGLVHLDALPRGRRQKEKRHMAVLLRVGGGLLGARFTAHIPRKLSP